MDLIGERWALLVMRELMTGPKRFSDIKAGLPGISNNVLTQRLEGLEASGIVVRQELPPPAAARVYALTEWGYEAEPILQVLGRWAARSPWHDPTAAFSSASCVLSLRTMFDADRAGSQRIIVGFRIGHETYRAEIDGPSFTIQAGTSEAGTSEAGGTADADVVIEGTAGGIGAAIYSGQPLQSLERAGAVTVKGDRAAFARFRACFPLPDKAPPPAN